MHPYSEWATAVGTVGAAVLAGVSAIAAVQVARQQRAMQYVELRLSYLVELLHALESRERHRPEFRPLRLRQAADPAPQHVEYKEARARFDALLIVVREELKWTRKIKKVLDDPDCTEEMVDDLMGDLEKLDTALKYGSPGDDVRVLVQRGEMKRAIDALHDEINKPGGLLRAAFGNRR